MPEFAETFAKAVRFWEPRRILYNAMLAAVVLAWIIFSWPHFRPALHWWAIAPLTVLAVLANVFYCAAYLPDLAFQHSNVITVSNRGRWLLWIAGMLFAVLLANYWIADEIYPFVQ
jgi:hypothetical protein